MSIKEDMDSLLERKSPKASMMSLRRWLRGAVPVVSSYAVGASKAAQKIKDPDLKQSMLKVADMVNTINSTLKQLKKELEKGIKGL